MVFVSRHAVIYNITFGINSRICLFEKKWIYENNVGIIGSECIFYIFANGN